jgi:hypothetical protein
MGAGNRGSQYTLIGTVDPTANVTAPQGTTYFWINGDLTQQFVKSTGSGAGGWSQLSVGTPSFAPFNIPTDAASWATFIADHSLTTPAPDISTVFQDAASNPVNSIGAITFTASGAVTYHETEPGYTRSPTDWFEGLPDNGASTGFSTTSGSLPDPATTSYLLVVIGRITAIPAGNRSLFMLTGSTANQVRLQSTGKFRVLLANNDVPSVNAIDTTGVHIFTTGVNETANTTIFATDVEKMTPGYVSPPASTKGIAIGGFDLTSAPIHIRAAYVFLGTNAEAFFVTGALKALYAAFGTGVPWS